MLPEFLVYKIDLSAYGLAVDEECFCTCELRRLEVSVCTYKTHEPDLRSSNVNLRNNHRANGKRNSELTRAKSTEAGLYFNL